MTWEMLSKRALRVVERGEQASQATFKVVNLKLDICVILWRAARGSGRPVRGARKPVIWEASHQVQEANQK